MSDEDEAKQQGVFGRIVLLIAHGVPAVILTVVVTKLSEGALKIFGASPPWALFLAHSGVLIGLATLCFAATRADRAARLTPAVPDAYDVWYLAGAVALVLDTLTWPTDNRQARVAARLLLPGLVFAYLFTLGRVGLTLPPRSTRGEALAAALLGALAAPFVILLTVLVFGGIPIPPPLPRGPLPVLGTTALLCFLCALLARQWTPILLARHAAREPLGEAPASPPAGNARRQTQP